MKLLHDVLRFQAARKPRHIALIDKDRLLTYEALWKSVQSLSLKLSESFAPQTRIGILLPNSLEMVRSLYGISAAGMISVPLDADMHPRNIRYIVEHCQIQLVITSQKLHHHIRKTNVLDSVNFLLLDRWEEDRPRKKSIFCGQHISPSDIACILYTTGTTGPQKGVALSQFNLLSATKNINQFMHIGPEIIESLPMRLSHSFGFGRLRCVFAVGGTVVLENGFLRPEHILDHMKRTEANALASVPAGIAILLDSFSEFFKEVGPQIRHVEIGSDFMHHKHKKQIMEHCPRARICLHYGLTEASRATFLDFHNDHEHLDTVGKPSPNVSIKIIDDQGQALGANLTGEILVKGDMVMVGYWGNPELTQKTLRGGWLHTGDLGFSDENGYIHLVGRKEELINRGGLKVAPAEVEEILLQFDGVLDAAVTACPSHEDGFPGEIKAFIIVDDRSKFENMEELKKHCLNELEAYKVPNEFEIVDHLPPSALGKKKRHLI